MKLPGSDIDVREYCFTFTAHYNIIPEDATWMTPGQKETLIFTTIVSSEEAARSRAIEMVNEYAAKWGFTYEEANLTLTEIICNDVV